MMNIFVPTDLFSHALPLHPADTALACLLDDIWRQYFSDVPRLNQIIAGYDFPWKRALGRIRMSMDQHISEITLNGLLDDVDVPDAVRIAIVSHEIVHYAQGFGSPHARTHRHAHAHGTVSHELARRCLDSYEQYLDEWVQSIWPSFSIAARARRGYKSLVYRPSLPAPLPIQGEG
jgi:hypothetical protein